MEANESKMVRFTEDQVILQQGSTEKVLYKIIHGKAIVYLNYGQEDEYIVGILSEQRCFGEFTILCGKPSIYTVVAYSDVLLLRIPEEDFDDFIRRCWGRINKFILPQIVSTLKISHKFFF
ncbi:MAG: cyclic nucleotide-binding domain-containing protein [Hungatella sp.]|nr:cyclic nucleotide-binding domain-containing protein [Hungatella sp.]